MTEAHSQRYGFCIFCLTHEEYRKIEEQFCYSLSFASSWATHFYIERGKSFFMNCTVSPGKRCERMIVTKTIASYTSYENMPLTKLTSGGIYCGHASAPQRLVGRTSAVSGALPLNNKLLVGCRPAEPYSEPSVMVSNNLPSPCDRLRHPHLQLPHA